MEDVICITSLQIEGQVLILDQNTSNVSINSSRHVINRGQTSPIWLHVISLGYCVLCHLLFWTLSFIAFFTSSSSTGFFSLLSYTASPLSLSLSHLLSWPHAQRKWTSPLSDGVRQFDLASLVPRLIDCPGVYLSHLPLPCILNQGLCNSSPPREGSLTPGLTPASDPRLFRYPNPLGFFSQVTV